LCFINLSFFAFQIRGKTEKGGSAIGRIHKLGRLSLLRAERTVEVGRGWTRLDEDDEVLCPEKLKSIFRSQLQSFDPSFFILSMVPLTYDVSLVFTTKYDDIL
jgi:hypothetical protein